MRIFGLPVPFTKHARRGRDLVPAGQKAGAGSSLSSVQGSGWWRILESFQGAQQLGVVVDHEAVLSYNAVYACITLIASDISKLRVKLLARDSDGIWSETRNPAYSPLLKKPNHFQTRIQFFENWLLSKLTCGNTYALKGRDARGVVNALYILDPKRVKPLVSEQGEVFYQLYHDDLVGVGDDVCVPAREIIHDRFNTLFHPLVGTSPIFAAGVAATQGLNIQNDSAQFFGNRSRPAGILTAPGAITETTAVRIKEYWDTNFTGANSGKVAVLGDQLDFKPMSMSAEDAQLIEQLKWTAEVVCSVFHVPPYKIGIGEMPKFNNIQSLNIEYYSQGLQRHIEDIELGLNEGLTLSDDLGTEFDLDGLLRMDSVTQMNVMKEGISAGILKPDEARRRLGLGRVAGGDTPYLQQQNFSLAALAKRDAKDDPFAKSEVPTPAAPAAANENEPDDEAAAAAFEAGFLRGLAGDLANG